MEYTYNGEGSLSKLVHHLSDNDDDDSNDPVIASYEFERDNLGRLIRSRQVNGSNATVQRTEHIYDAIGRLSTQCWTIGEQSYSESYTYAYDTAGNILSVKKNGATIKSYTYSTGDWKDLLTSVTVGNTTHTLQYDQSGNPTIYGNGERLYTNLTWEHGRQLVSLTTGGKTSTFEYDHEGIRTKKIYNSVYHNYVTQNGKVVRETVQSADWDWVLDFIYDNAGRPFALKYSYDGGSNFETYYYILSLQGDVVALMNASGTIVARYTYNAWGEILSATGEMAETNPLRYRGYYYDSETGFYYLQSRYYDPENCRFINADNYTHGY